MAKTCSKWLVFFCSAASLSVSHAQMVVRRWLPEPTGSRIADSTTVSRMNAADLVVRFDLSIVPRDRTIYRADLRLLRESELAASDADAQVSIEVYPLVAAAVAGNPDKAAGPLQIRGPWFDRLDATEAVRHWVAGATNGGFLVAAAPRCRPETICLDVAYEGMVLENLDSRRCVRSCVYRWQNDDLVDRPDRYEVTLLFVKSYGSKEEQGLYQFAESLSR